MKGPRKGLLFRRSLNVGSILGGSWVVISGVLSPLIWVITVVTLLLTPFITTPEPPSRGLGSGFPERPGLGFWGSAQASLWLRDNRREP